MFMTELITLENETPTVTSGNWDQRATTVTYERALYRSTTVDGDETESAQRLANEVDQLTAAQASANLYR
jgi:hypothetical protein